MFWTATAPFIKKSKIMVSNIKIKWQIIKKDKSGGKWCKVPFNLNKGFAKKLDPNFCLKVLC